MKYSFSISEEFAGMRLDLFLSRNLAGQSRSAIQKMIEEGQILVGGHAVKSSYKIRKGDRIVVDVSEETMETELEPWDFPLNILYEDNAFLAVFKPPHLVVHPGAGRSQHTLVHALIHHRPEIARVGHPLRPGIVHRLDKETSGVLLVARTQEAYLAFVSLFKNRKMEKHYRALAFGHFPVKQGTIDKSLGRDPHDRKKISVRARKSREAVTHYRVLLQRDFAALLDVRILTGRTHQIRVHLSSEGHPIVGDSKYGGGNWNRVPDPVLQNRWKEASFFGLHALSLDFQHPFRDEAVHIEAPLPEIWKITGDSRFDELPR